jgi:glycosyltransferase involved in cell wall biosynthesis
LSGKKCDISVIVTAHREGCLAHHAIKSILRSIDYATKFDISAEIIAVLDAADMNTTNYFKRHQNALMRLEHTNFGDPGPARNHGVAVSSGKYVSFLDADDLFCRTWLKASFDAAEKMNRRCVFHPELVVCFGNDNMIAKIKSVYDKDFNAKNLIQYNYWNSVHFLALKEVLTENPFLETPPGSGFGYEDWHWHCEIIAQDIPVVTVPETVVFYRKKQEDSRFTSHGRQNVLIRPTRLFTPGIFEEVINKFGSQYRQAG